MTGGFFVDPEQLRTHAASVDGVASAVEEAHTAAGIENIGGLVYGVLFDPLILVGMGAWQLHLQELMGSASDTATSIAGGLRSNAETYDGTEQANHKTITKSGQGPR